MKLTSEEQRELRKALREAFPKPAQLALVVSDADIGETWEGLTCGVTEYEPCIDAVLSHALTQPARLERLLKTASAANPGNPPLQEITSRLRAREQTEQRAREADQLKQYLEELIKLFALTNVEGVTAADLAQLLRVHDRCEIPLAVSEVEGAEQGQDLASYLQPGARLLVLAEYPDGLVPLVHQAIVAVAQAAVARLALTGEPPERLPVIYSEHWGLPGCSSWHPRSAQEYVSSKQARYITAGRAVICFDRWNRADMAKALAAAASARENIIVIGARPGSEVPDGFQRLYPCPLTPAAQRQLAELWLPSDAASRLLKGIHEQPELCTAARSPYLLMVMSIAERLRIEEVSAWTGADTRAEDLPRVPALLMLSLLRALWERKTLPGRLCGREAVSKELELDKYARQVLQLTLKGLGRVALEGAAGSQPATGSSATVKTAGFVEIARSTGLFVPATRDGARVLEPIHPALWDALAGYGLYKERNSYPRPPPAEQLDERWVALFARAADLMSAEAKGGTILNSECGNWLKRLYGGKDRALGLAAISRSVIVQRAGVQQLLGLRAVPERWSGYRLDRWRALEAKLRGLEALTGQAHDRIDVIRTLRKLVPGAHAFDLAIIRMCLYDLRDGYAQDGRSIPEELERLLDADRFFKLAGRPRSPAAMAEEWSLIPEQEAWIGAANGDPDAWSNERPLHRVVVPAFYMSALPVTNAQYQVFEPGWKAQQAQELDPLPQDWDRLPAVRVSWYEAWIYAEWMGAALPGEVQWERAAWGDRAGDRDRSGAHWFSNPAQFAAIVWSRKNAKDQLHPPGAPPGPVDDDFDPRPYDLHDMLGNTWEWCADEQGYDYQQAISVYEQPYRQCARGRRSYLINRVIRGGSWDSEEEDCRCSARQFAYPAVRSDVIGFRLVRTA